MATITMYNDINVDDAFTPTFVAVGYNTNTGASTNDTTSAWVSRTLPATSNWNSVAYGNKQIVAIAAGTKNTAYSPTGVTWTARVDALPTAVNWQSLLYGTRFVAIANGSTDTAYSVDGITWSQGGSMPSAAAWYCLAYGGGRFVAVSTTSSTDSAYSSDQGANWYPMTGLTQGNWQSVAFGKGVFVAVSYGSSDAAVSSNGTSWSARSLPSSQNWSSVTWGNPNPTIYPNGLFVAVAYGSAVGAISTNLGESWTQVSLGPDVVLNGNFLGNADGWTLNANWAYDTNKITHTAGSAATVVPNPALSVTTGLLYEVTYTITDYTAGTITASIGGVSGTARSAVGTYTQVITASGNGNLTFTPSTTFVGSISNISVRFAHNWNCVSYGEISAQGVKVFTVTAYGTTAGMALAAVSFDGSDWFLKAIISASNWKYHCFAPVIWNSGDTLSIQNNAKVTVSTHQDKFWKTFTATYGQLAIKNTSTSVPIGFYMGRASAATANDISPVSGAFSIDIDGDWIQLGTGTGVAGQTFNASYSEYIPSLWIETGNNTNVFEIWNNVSGATGPYMKMFGRDGLELVGSGKRGNYFVQTPATNPLSIFDVSSGNTTIQSYFVTCADTSGILAGAYIVGTNIPANTVVNKVVDGVTLELNVVCTATGTGYTFTIYNPVQSQWTKTIVVGDGIHGNVIPNGARVRQPNILFSDKTNVSVLGASHLTQGYINMSAGGIISAQRCLFGESYVNFTQAASVYLRDVGFSYQFALAECYSVNMDGVGCAAGPTVWYYSSKWIIRDPRYGTLAPTGYASSTGGQSLTITYIHNASIKNWHIVVYCSAYFTGNTIAMPLDLSYTDDAVFENIRISVLVPTRLIRCLNISNRVYRTTFTNLQLYGCPPIYLSTSDNNTFSNIEYSPSMYGSFIKGFKSAMRISQDASGNLLSDNTPYFFKTRSFYSWANRDLYGESGEYSCTPFQNSWLFPDTMSVRPTETVPASVTIDWTRRDPTSATALSYEIFRSTSTISTYNTSNSIYRSYAPGTLSFANGPRTSFTSTAVTNYFVFAPATKRITLTGSSIGSFTTAGFAYVAGDVIDISGTSLNDGTYTVNAVNTAYLTVNEAVVTEICGTGPTLNARPPLVDTKYYYRMRKFHTATVKPDVNGISGSTTLSLVNSTTSVGALSFNCLYSLTDFYFEAGSDILRNRKAVLFNTPFYVGAYITGTGIPANTKIISMDAAGQELEIDHNTTQAGENITVYLPVQAGMAVVNANSNKPNAGIPYGTTVVSVDSSSSLTISNALTADLCTVSVVNGTFSGNANGWTLTAGWTYANNKVSHLSAGTTTITPSTPLVAEIGKTYTITYTISDHTGAGTNNVTASFGGANGVARSGNGVWQDTITAVTTGSLYFTPVTGFRGSIDDVSIGAPITFLPFTESAEFVVTPHDSTVAKNYCLQNRTLATTWVASGVTVTAANTYAAPTEITWSTTATASRLVSTAPSGTVTMTVNSLTGGNVYSASIWLRADQTIALPNGVSGTLTWAGTTTAFTATNDWKMFKVENVTASGTSHTFIITITTSGQTIWAADAVVSDGPTASTVPIVTTTTQPVTLKPPAIPITTMYAYCRPSLMCGSNGNQGILVTLGTAPTGSYYHEIYMSTESGFVPSDSNMVATTWVLDDYAPFYLTGSNYNNFSNIEKLQSGGCSTSATMGVFTLAASSSNNAFVNANIDYTYCNTTAVPALHLSTPSQNNVFHNINFGRVANYLAISCLWHTSTTLAPNSVTGNRMQNIFAKHYDLGFNDQTLSAKYKGFASGNAYPATGSTTYLLGGSAVDDVNLVKAQAYGSMFNELYFGNGNGALHIVFEDTQGIKPYTFTGSPKFSNTGRLFLPTLNDSLTITWPWKIKGVTGFRNVMRRMSGVDFGNNVTILDGLKLEYKINDDINWKRLKGVTLKDEGALDATNGFDLQIKLTPLQFMKFSTQTIGTYVTHTAANPGVITKSSTTWAVGQKVLYTTTGTPFGGLTNETFYYIAVVPSATTMQITTTPGGTTGMALNDDLGTGVHTFEVLFETGDTIMGATSFATATVDEVYYDTRLTGTITLTNVEGSWVAGEVIKTSDNRAIKATNVATNGFALGPAYTSNINALQIATTVDQTKLYDAAIVTVTLNNIVPGSQYYIYNTDTLDQIATGTATGTPLENETTIDYNVSVVYEENFNITVNVRKSTAPVKYLPYETGSVVTSDGANVFIAQVVDTVVLDTYGSIADDWEILLSPNETIKHKNGTTVYSVKQLYSYLQDYFDNLGYVDDQIPMSASTPTEYNLINGWFIDDLSFKYLSGGSVTTIGQNGEIYLLTFQESGYTNAVPTDITKTVHNSGSTHTGILLDYDNSRRIWWIKKITGTLVSESLTITNGIGAGTTNSVATGESAWSNIFTLGTLVSGTTLDVYQNDVQLTPWWSSGHIDILVKVKEFGNLTDGGNITILARDYTTYGSLYDHFVITAISGRNPVPLAAFADGNNQTLPSTVGAYAGFTFAFGHVNKDMNNGHGPQPYDCVVECSNHTILEIYEYLKYVTRSGSSTTINGVNGEYYTGVGDVRFNYDNLVNTFVQGELITGTGGARGYLVSLTATSMVLRNVHGTFTNDMVITGASATASVNGAVTSITAQKQAPFGTFAGGQFFGVRGVWLEHVAPADTNNYQLIDSLGAIQSPPALISVTVTGLEIDDMVSVFRTTGDNKIIDKTYLHSHSNNNQSASTSWEVDSSTPIPSDTPASGFIRIVKTSTKVEERIAYNSWAGNLFTLATSHSGGYDGTDTAYVPFIDTVATSSTASVSISFSQIRFIYAIVRHKGIVPFDVKGTITSTGFSLTAIRTTDSIVS